MTGNPKQSSIEACRNGDLPLAKSIMQDHNDFKAQQESYVYPDTLIKHAVDEAAWKNHAPIVAFLLDNGASITNSVVLAVSKSRDKPMLEEILKRGFDINTVEPGATLLRLSTGHTEWMEVLLQHGADPNVKDSRGRTALHSAVIKPSLQPCQLLLDHGATLPRDILQSAIGFKGASMDMVKYLIEKGADLNYVRNIKTGYKIWQGTPLHVAAGTNRLDIAQLLLSAGADPGIKYWDNTPADTAKEFDYMEMHNLLKADAAPDGFSP
ncbi:hypothetical protein CPAR01_11410 [Colletotrichum paranaense]|uniref:Ankyrin repeat protein n=1 Tax=Colletotrichum paranaense TaxID=1914294 RepID=A0ABQ9SCT5_9PEZI|nr:uncharacterized protein CPAR01_11410 [Colletotrichum paranaense]KAK1531761.1 hypothetical protein CPAR01_11410 [Colletotrichum paranaense]